MLNDDLIELYSLINEEIQIKNKIKFIRQMLSDNKDNQEELKVQILHGLNTINHKYAEYKNMSVTLVKKPDKIKLNKIEVESQIENIIDDESLPTSTEKRQKIIEILKPMNVGTTKDVLVVKIKKKSK